MIRSVYYTATGNIERDLSPDDIRRALKDHEGLLWVSLEHPNGSEIQSVLSDLFHFHPLAIEDCLNDGYQTAKLDDYGAYLFLVANALKPGEGLTVETGELDLFLGENYLVTCFTDEFMKPVEDVWNRLGRDERLTINGSDFLCHAVLDHLVDDYMPLLDEMDDEIEWLEDEVLSKPNPVTLERILKLKHTVMSLRRIISPQREVINRLSRDEFPIIDRQSRMYFRDIYDHLVRIQDLSESIRDIVSGTLDIYLNSTSLRLNEVMKALTIVSTIFLPLSFLAGVYGMNFLTMPELAWGYPWIWIIFLLVAFGMLWFFRRRQWF